MKRLALIDGDEVAFKAVAVTATNIQWDDGEPDQAPSAALAVRAAKELVTAWAQKVEADEIIVCLSCRDRKLFRRDIYPAYKTERTEKPVAFWAAVDALSAAFEVREYPGLEADDVMGIHSGKEKDRQPIIVSSDKDMKTIAGAWIFSPYHGTKKKVTEEAGNRYWMTQTITGDPSDGYKGIPGAGPKRAEKILEGLSSLRAMWAAVADAYRVAGLTSTAAITQARLARILRPGDYDFSKKEPILWNP